MKRIVLLVITLMILCGISAGCSREQPLPAPMTVVPVSDERAEPDGSNEETPPVEEAPPETAESPSDIEAPEPASYYFEAQYIRTDGHADGVSYPVVTLIESKAELDAYYKANADKYELERHDAVYADQTIGFLNACDRYDQAYFDDERNLVLILLEEPSGSIRHEITDVRRNNQGEWVISIDRILPECGEDDMAEWHLFLEIQMGNVIRRDDTIIVNLKDTVR